MLILKIKIMPSSPEIDLEKIKEKVKEKFKELKAEFHSFEIEEIAFGLKALIFTILWPEKSAEIIEEKLKKLENVNSVEIIDVRRTIG